MNAPMNVSLNLKHAFEACFTLLKLRKLKLKQKELSILFWAGSDMDRYVHACMSCDVILARTMYPAPAASAIRESVALCPAFEVREKFPPETPPVLISSLYLHCSHKKGFHWWSVPLYS